MLSLTTSRSPSSHRASTRKLLGKDVSENTEEAVSSPLFLNRAIRKHETTVDVVSKTNQCCKRRKPASKVDRSSTSATSGKVRSLVGCFTRAGKTRGYIEFLQYQAVSSELNVLVISILHSCWQRKSEEVLLATEKIAIVPDCNAACARVEVQFCWVFVELGMGFNS